MQPASPNAPQPLVGIEGEAPHVAEGAHRLALPVVAVALGAVLHHLEAVAAGDLHDAGHVAGLTEQVHRQDGLGAGGDGGLDLLRVDVVVSVRLHEHRGCPVHGDAHDAGDVGVGADDDLVAPADAQQTEADPQRVQPAGKAHAVFGADVFGPLGFKLLHLAAQNVPAAAQHFQGFRLVLGGVQAVLTAQIVGQDVHLGPLPFCGGSRTKNTNLYFTLSRVKTQQKAARRAAKGPRRRNAAAGPLWFC